MKEFILLGKFRPMDKKTFKIKEGEYGVLSVAYSKDGFELVSSEEFISANFLEAAERIRYDRLTHSIEKLFDTELKDALEKLKNRQIEYTSNSLGLVHIVKVEPLTINEIGSIKESLANVSLTIDELNKYLVNSLEDIHLYMIYNNVVRNFHRMTSIHWFDKILAHINNSELTKEIMG